MTARFQLSNARARLLFLAGHGLGDSPSGAATGSDLLDVIQTMGFVQVDSINTVARAHHMILSSRRQRYRCENLTPLLERDRQVFEHWTHDASIIPTAYFPHWRLRFRRDADRLRRQWKAGRRDGFEQKFDTVLAQIAKHGPCCSADVGRDETRGSGGWWDWHPSKTALEYLWRTGQISVTRREGFRKFYDLTENVIPAGPLTTQIPEDATIDWACRSALGRLGFATAGEIAAFWDLATPAQARDWCAANLAARTIQEIDVGSCDGSPPRRCFGLPQTLAGLDQIAPPPARVRILSPFDPVLRDRKRALRLFGFDYRIEVFVPQARRKYGYYVFPVIEGATLIGRIDMKCHRDSGTLAVRAFWPETGIAMGAGRQNRILAELQRTARLAGSGVIAFEKDWLRDRVAT